MQTAELPPRELLESKLAEAVRRAQLQQEEQMNKIQADLKALEAMFA